MLIERLNKILPRITSDDFLTGRGIGNEIGFYIFEYPPENELQVRDHVSSLLEHIAKEKPDLKVKYINLFDFVLEYLASRNLLKKALKMQQEKGDEALRKALSAPLHENKLAPLVAQAAEPETHDLILISGIGSAWPLLVTDLGRLPQTAKRFAIPCKFKSEPKKLNPQKPKRGHRVFNNDQPHLFR